MNYGFHLATTGVITGMRRLDTIANNLANSTTVGYKADRLTMSPRSAENVERPGAYADANAMLDALGGGTLFLPNAIDLRQGTLRQTGSPLDVALEGDGFFRLEVPASSATRGAKSRDALLTRAGTLTRDPSGKLVLATSGAAILGKNGAPIVLDADDPNVRIDADGRVTQSGTEVGQIDIVIAENPANLRKEGRDALRLVGGRTKPAPESTAVRQNHVEESVVDPVASLAELVKVSRGIEFSTRLMQQQDQITGRLIDTFGRFA
ncbi:MAG: flagellar hook-basal body protein [Limnohabitans sp.]|jgi:flagellar basal body rod protein FlgG|nr:flagellar hook-basal body protein [Limnohabitans sp.]